MAATVTAGGRSEQSQWARKYPPLLALAVAVLIAMAVLPSSLNLPQTNPATTLEYAPVPPSDENPPPPSGNLSSLGLAGSSSLEGGGAPGGDGGLPVNDLTRPGRGASALKRCVGRPPRQTDDPLSPPCVAEFRGNNFGTTWQGVNAEEVKVLFYVQGFTRYTNTCRDPNQITPDRQYFDLLDPAEPGEHCYVRALRTWQQYFNERYQTYKRYVHFYVYFSGSGESAEERRADAADNYSRVKPFAVMSVGAGQTFVEDYLEYMAKRKVLNFGAFTARGDEFYNAFPRLIWGYPPSLEQGAKLFSQYICRKVAGNPVDFAGDATLAGRPRKYGLWYTRDAGHPELVRLAQQVKSDVAKCPTPVTFAAESQFPEAGYAKSAHYTNAAATRAAAEFQGAEVTTVIWPSGLETNFSAAAASIGYRPEILVLGDGDIETATSALFQEQSVWDRSRVVSFQPALVDIRTSLCYTAYREVDAEGDDTEIQVSACPLYPQIRQLFTGIQVAGPKLSPTTVDQGFHAIPRVASTNPEIPACFYDPGDYTCVKDANVQYWDRTGSSSTSSAGQGCYRLVEGGKRYFADIWPEGNVTVADRPGQDPCTSYDGGFLINPAPPDANDPG
jgi:hypothetical protein